MKTFLRVEKIKKSNFSALPFKNIVVASLLINIGVIAVAFLFQGFLPPQVPIFYGMAEAEKIVSPSLSLVIPALVSGALWGLNLLISLFIQEEFLKKTLAIVSLAASFFAGITVVKIIFLVGSF